MDGRRFDRMWDQLRQKYGVYLRVLEAIPEDDFHKTVVPGMRTPAELVVHTSGAVVRDIARGVAEGEIKHADPPEHEIASGLSTKRDVLAYASQCWTDADAAARKIGDAELKATVQTPWEMSFPGWVGFNVLNDEFLHHRGQLYAYARISGSEPPFLWSFADNAPGFRPVTD